MIMTSQKKSLGASASRLFLFDKFGVLFLHKRQSTDRILRLDHDEVHTIVQAFKVECGHAIGVALLVDLLSQAVEYHNFAVFLRKVDADLAMARVGIHRKHIFTVLIQTNTSAKNKLGIGTVVAHLLWTDKRPEVMRIQVPNVAAIAKDRVGCIRVSEISNGIIFGILVYGNQQVVGAVVGKWSVELDGDPAIIIGRDGPWT